MLEIYNYIIKAENLKLYKVSSSYSWGDLKVTKLEPGMYLPEYGLVLKVQKPLVKPNLLRKLFTKPTCIQIEDFKAVVDKLEEISNQDLWDLEDSKIQEVLKSNSIKSIRHIFSGLRLEGKSGKTYYLSGGCTKDFKEWYFD